MRIKHGPIVVNFIVRFLYEAFLEVCLCTMITITVFDVSSFTAGARWITSLLLTVGIVASFIFLLKLLRKDGPYISGYYKKGSFLKSRWTIRKTHKDVRNISHYNRMKAARLASEAELNPAPQKPQK